MAPRVVYILAMDMDLLPYCILLAICTLYITSIDTSRFERANTMGKSKGKRSASYRAKQTKNRRKAKRKRQLITSEERNAEKTVLAQDPPSPIATEVVYRDGSNSTDVRKENTRQESKLCGKKQSASDGEDRECGECQRLHILLYEEQRRPRVFHSECIQCQRKREAKIVDAKQSLQYRMYSGESLGSRCLLAALAAKKKMHRTTSSKQV